MTEKLTVWKGSLRGKAHASHGGLVVEAGLVDEVKRKREFSGLLDSVVLRALDLVGGDVKDARALLRKYFGVFLTNRVLKGKGDLLGMHMSSKKRDYQKFYSKIFGVVGGLGRLGEDFDDCRHREVGSIIDLGCGVNGFSYKYLPRGVSYVGVEAVGQLVDLTNGYFEEEGVSAEAVCMDLFDVDLVVDILKNSKKPRVVFLFQVVDALEGLERDFSKRFLLEISGECEWIVLSLPMESLGSRKKFESRRKWLVDFLSSKDGSSKDYSTEYSSEPRERFVIVRDFVENGERTIILKNKK